MHSNIKPIKLLLIGAMFIAISACNNNKKDHTIMTQDNTSIFPRGDKLSSEYFTGNAFLYPLQAKDKNNQFALGSVTFEPGARTNWHMHPKGQVLIVTEGEGFYQEKGKPARGLKKGDIVNIPEDTEHWHGASAGSKFVHIAITNYKGEQNVIWLKPVSDQEYKEVNKNK
jgi:quercetin dioxygenase-like cupin family protein